MTRTVNVQEAKLHLSRLLEEVQRGDEIAIAGSGAPCARLVPLTEDSKREIPIGFLKIDFPETFFDPLPPEELEAFEAAYPVPFIAGRLR